MSALRTTGLALACVLSFVRPVISFASSLEDAEVILRIGSYANVQTNLTTEPAAALRGTLGASHFCLDGLVEKTDPGMRLRSANLSCRIDLWRSNRFALDITGGAMHEPVTISTGQSGFHTQARLSYSGQSRGLWLSSATAHPLGVTNVGGRFASGGGAWLHLGRVGVAATIERTLARTRELVVVATRRPDGSPYWPDEFITVYESVYRDRKVATNELRLGMSVVGSRLDVMPSAGLRHESMRGTQRWIQVDASYWIVSQFAFVTQAFTTRGPGSAAGYEGGWSVTIGGRLAPWRKGSRPASKSGVTSIVERWDLVEGSEGGRMLRVWAQGASRVYLQGDVTDWLTVMLEDQRDGSWCLNLGADRGPHMVLVRVGDGPWAPLPGAPIQDDGFGRVVSVLVVD